MDCEICKWVTEIQARCFIFLFASWEKIHELFDRNFVLKHYNWNALIHLIENAFMKRNWDEIYRIIHRVYYLFKNQLKNVFESSFDLNIKISIIIIHFLLLHEAIKIFWANKIPISYANSRIVEINNWNIRGTGFGTVTAICLIILARLRHRLLCMPHTNKLVVLFFF